MVSKEILENVTVEYIVENYEKELNTKNDFNVLINECFSNLISAKLFDMENRFKEIIYDLLSYRYLPEVYQTNRILIDMLYVNTRAKLSLFKAEFDFKTTSEFIDYYNHLLYLIHKNSKDEYKLFTINDYNNLISLSLSGYYYGDISCDDYSYDKIISLNFEDYIKKYAITDIAKGWN